MKSITNISNVTFAVFVFCLAAWCCGEEDMDVAPMEKTEKEALYSAIRGFVGNWWNGSALYPDPCGWTPIQVLLAPTYRNVERGVVKLPWDDFFPCA